MTDIKRNIDRFLDEKLRSSGVSKTSEAFSSFLMNRISEENKKILAESKSDRVVKYVIGSFTALLIGITVLMGVLSGSSASVHSSRETAVNFSPAIESSNNYLERFISFIQSIFAGLLNLLGISASSKSFSIILMIVAVVTLFLAADKFLMRGKLRSETTMK